MVSRSVAHPRLIRFVTINTAKGDPPYWSRLDRLFRSLRAIDADVVLLQEAFVDLDGTDAHTARHVAEALDMHLAYSAARRKARVFEGSERLTESGMAVLSRLPITHLEAVQLPSDPRDGERVAQLVVLQTSHGPLLAANVHLTHLRDGAALRQAQFQTLVGHPVVARHYAARIVGGDFNADVPAVDGWDLCDLYAAGGGSELRATLPSSGRCIDFLVSIARSGHPRAASAAVVLDGDQAASDHYGVMVDLELGR